MPDYIYLLENRLSPAQQSALKLIREAARDAQMTVFLTGGAVRDLTSGSPVRDLDVSVQGNALKLQKAIEKEGGVFWGSDIPSQTLFFRFPGGVRAEVSSTRRVEYPKPGKPVYHWDTILEDLRRRDFTANAMALSLNEGSYGLLMDPLNGVADIEARQLRLVSNYGFIEEPARLIRATRFVARLGWELDDKNKTRFDNAMVENMVESLSRWQAAYELEEIGHEEDALKILGAMEAQGWMKHLYPAWTTAKADVAALGQMREVLTQLQMQGVNPDISAASMELLTAKMAPREVTAMKALFVRQGFVEEWNSLDARAREFGKVLTSKQASTPSAIWKLFTTSNPDAVLWLGLTGKSPAIQEKYKNFFTVWPEARQKIPYTLMQEMRITPELPGYQDLLQSLFYEFIDGRLQTEEELKAFLEPFSPPAPPPPVTVRRTRAPKKAIEGRGKGKQKDVLQEDADAGEADGDEAELPEVDPLSVDETVEEDEDEDEGDPDDTPGKPGARTSGAKAPALYSVVMTERSKSVAAENSSAAGEKASPKPSAIHKAAAAPIIKADIEKVNIKKSGAVLGEVNGSSASTRPLAGPLAGKDGKPPARAGAAAQPAALKPASKHSAPKEHAGTSEQKGSARTHPEKAAAGSKASPGAKGALPGAKGASKNAAPATAKPVARAVAAKSGTPAAKKLAGKQSGLKKPAPKKLDLKKPGFKAPGLRKAALKKPIAARKAAGKVAAKKSSTAAASRKPLKVSGKVSGKPSGKKALAARKKR